MNYLAERRQEEKERRRAEILDAAEAVTASVGWDALTMDQVARRGHADRQAVAQCRADRRGAGGRTLRDRALRRVGVMSTARMPLQCREVPRHERQE